MSRDDHALFSKSYNAFLFDMDGTLLNSIAVVERVWSEWAVRHGMEPEVFLKTVHGIRAVDVLKRLALPGVDPDVEAALLLDEEMRDATGIIAIPGAIDFLKALPADKWAIVTSAPRDLFHLRMKAAGIPYPEIVITGEDVIAGKPSPEGYLLGASKLGVSADRCVVFEDAVAGILAGEAAGAQVVVITATHSGEYDTPHVSIGSYDTLVATQADDGALVLTRRQARPSTI